MKCKLSSVLAERNVEDSGMNDNCENALSSVIWETCCLTVFEKRMVSSPPVEFEVDE